MPARPHAIVHYHEIGLKGRNRSHFENILVRNMAGALAGTGAGKPRKLPGRILVPLTHADSDVRDTEDARESAWVSGRSTSWPSARSLGMSFAITTSRRSPS